MSNIRDFRRYDDFSFRLLLNILHHNEIFYINSKQGSNVNGLILLLILKFFLIISGIHNRICPRGVTCCTPEMETKLWTLSRDTYTQALASSTAHLQATFQAKSRKFDGKSRQYCCRTWCNFLNGLSSL